MPNPTEDYIASQKRLAERIYKPGGVMPPTIFGRVKHYFVYGWKWKSDKLVIWGPYDSKAEADGYLQKLRDGDIFESTSRDLTKSTREIKAMLLMQGGFKNRTMTVDDVTERSSHKYV